MNGLKVDACMLDIKISFLKFFLIFLLRKMRIEVELDQWIRRQSDGLLIT
jgi:hypothetical protein